MPSDVYDLSMNAAGYTQGARQATQATQDLQNAMSSLTQGSYLAQAALNKVMPVAALGTFSKFTNQAAAAQSELHQLHATALASGQSFTALSQASDKLARNFNVGTSGARQMVATIQSLGVSASQHSTKVYDLASAFIKLGAATGEAGSVIGPQIANLSRAFGDKNLNPALITRMGDSLVALQSKFGGSASSILSFSQAISPFTRAAGLSSQATLGIAASFTKLGDDSLAASTAVSRMFDQVTTSTRDGGPLLQKYSALVGQTAGQFKDLFSQNPAQQMAKIVAAIAGSGPTGGRFLDQIGLSFRSQRSLIELSQGGGLQQAVDAAVNAPPGTLNKSAKESMATFNDSLGKLSDASTQAAEKLGTPILQPLTLFAKALTWVTDVFAKITGNSAVQGLLSIAGGGAVSLGAGAFLGKGLFGIGAANRVRRSATLGMGRLSSYAAGRGVDFRGEGGIEATQSLLEQEAIGGGNSFERNRAKRLQAVLNSPEMQRALTRPPGGAWGGIQDAVAGAASGFRMPSPQQIAIDEVQARQVHSVRMANERAAQELQARQMSMRFYGGVTQGLEGGEAGNLAGNGRSNMDRLNILGYKLASSTAYGMNFKSRFMRAGVEVPDNPNILDAIKSGHKASKEEGSAGLYEELKKSIRAHNDVQLGLAKEGESLKLITKAAGNRLGAFASVLGSLASGLITPWGLAIGALTAGIGLFKQAQANNAAQKAATEAFGQSSTTASLDALRGAQGRGPAGTATVGDQSAAAEAARNIGTVDNFKKAGQVTQEDIKASAKGIPGLPTIEKNTDLGIAAAQINATYGTTSLQPGDVQKIKLNLLNSGYSKDDTQTILGQVNTAGGGIKGADTGTAIGGIVSDVKRGNKGAFSALGYNNYSVSKANKGRIDQLLQGIEDQHQHDSDIYGSEYADSKRAKAQNALLADVRTAGGSNFDAQSTGLYDKTGVGHIYKYITQGISRDIPKGTKVAQAGDYNKGGDYILGQNGPGIPLLGPGATYTAALNGDQDPNKIGTAVNKTGLSKGFLSFLDQRSGTGGVINTAMGNLAPDDAKSQNAAFNAVLQAADKAKIGLTALGTNAGTVAARIGNDPAGFGAVFARVEAATTAIQSARSGSAGASAGIEFAKHLEIAQRPLRAGATQEEAAAQMAQGQAAVDSLANLRAGMQQRLQAQMQFQLQSQRSQEDYGIQVSRTQEDFQISQTRSTIAFSLSMSRLAEDAAKSMYDPYHRIGMESIYDSKALLVNLGDQNKAMVQQVANLARARKMGLGNQAIQQLGLSDSAHAQQLSEIVGTATQGDIAGLNQVVAGRVDLAGKLSQDEGSLSFTRARADFQTQMKNQNEDFARSADRAAADFSRSQSRAAEDLHNSTLSISTDLNTIQKGLTQNMSFSSAESSKVLNDDLDTFKNVVASKGKSLTDVFNQAVNLSLGVDGSGHFSITLSPKDTAAVTGGANANSGLGFIPSKTTGSPFVNLPPSSSNAGNGDTTTPAPTYDPNVGLSGLFGNPAPTGDGGNRQPGPNGLYSAAGRLVTSKTNTTVGEAGAEAIIPLNASGLHIIRGIERYINADHKEAKMGGYAMHIQINNTQISDHSIHVEKVEVSPKDSREFMDQMQEMSRRANLTRTATRKAS